MINSNHNNGRKLTMIITNIADIFVLDTSWVLTSLILIFVLLLKVSNSF